MNARQLAPVNALSRLVEFVESTPKVNELARQCRALENARKSVDDLSNFVAEHAARVRQHPIVRANALDAQRTVQMLVDSVVAAAELGEYHDAAPLTALGRVNTDLSIVAYMATVGGFAAAARSYEAELLKCGMFPGRLEEIEDAVGHLSDRHFEFAISEALIETAPDTFEYLLRRTQKTVHSLFLQIRPLLDSEVQRQWRVTARLGRTHRPSSTRLNAPKSRLALPNPDHPVHDVPTTNESAA